MIIITRKELIDGLKGIGCNWLRQTGSHEIWSNGKKTFSVPLNLSPVIAIKLAKQAGLRYLLNQKK